MEVIQKLAAPNFNKPGIKVLQVLASTELDKLQLEVSHILENYSGSKVEKEGHATNWTNPYGNVTQYNLISSNGKMNDFSDNNGTVNEEYTALKDLVAPFKKLLSYRINIIHPESGLNQHKETTLLDNGDGNYNLKACFHLPTCTDDKCTVFLDGDLYHLQEGKLYYFNNSCVHSARNSWRNYRIHLVFDVLVDSFTLNLFKASKEVNPTGKEPISTEVPLDGDWQLDEKKEIKLYS